MSPFSGHANDSGATHATVFCTVQAGDFILTIQDNGQGIPSELDGRLDRGHGMASMKSRAKQMDGRRIAVGDPGVVEDKVCIGRLFEKDSETVLHFGRRLINQVIGFLRPASFLLHVCSNSVAVNCSISGLTPRASSSF